MKLLAQITTALALAGSAIAGPLDSFSELVERARPLKQAAKALQQVTSFGDNPSNTKMYIYLPTDLAAKPPVIVAIHYGTGTAQVYFSGSPYAQLAGQNGFIVIFPDSPYSGTCWDVSSESALTHDGGGDSNSIANMVNYTLLKYNGDLSKVFVTGSLSGAMMKNVMAATYPELFAAGNVYPGVAAGCLYSQSGDVDQWNSSCSTGEIRSSQAVWAGIVRDTNYSGVRTKMQMYHGTADATLAPQTYDETIEDWCGVFGFDSTKPDSTKANTSLSGYTTYTWEDKLIGVYAQGVGHTVLTGG